MPLSRSRRAAAWLAILSVGALLPVRASAAQTASSNVDDTPVQITPCGTESTTAARVACLALAFEATLSDSQRRAVELPLTDAMAAHWTNLPCGQVCRNGLRLGELTGTQAAAAEKVARAALSSAGYATFDGIRHADSYLTGRRPGYEYGAGVYFIALLGRPSAHGEWMLQLGGHHFAINVGYRDGATTTGVTPNFVGLEPQRFVVDGVTYAPLDTRRDAMYAMVQALTEAQRKDAEIHATLTDVVVGAGKDGQFPAPQGVLVSSLTTPQRTLVRAAIAAWVNAAPDDLAATLRADYESDSALDQTRVAWANGLTAAAQGYVRIDGPHVWIELVSSKAVMLSDQIHIHTVWRDKVRDYGKR
jgi:hypothetical protein